MRAIPTIIAVLFLLPLTVSGQVSDSDRLANAAWKRIADSAPYEWEGDVQGKAEWTFRNYGRFLEEHPRHPLAAEAMFKVAEATWASGGYVEVFHYIHARTWDEWHAKERYLRQWFDTRGFGGGLVPVVEPNIKQAVRAREMFLEVVAKYPAAKSAAMARYYAAVILDYCLSDSRAALVEYQLFVKNHPNVAPFAQKAKRRISVLRGAK